MQASQPHFLLFSEGRSQRRQRAEWKFVLQSVGGEQHFSAADSEHETRASRLELLAVVRGLEALGQPSRVTLLTRSRYVRRGIRRELNQWRDAAGGGNDSANWCRFAIMICGNASTGHCSFTSWNALLGRPTRSDAAETTTNRAFGRAARRSKRPSSLAYRAATARSPTPAGRRPPAAHALTPRCSNLADSAPRRLLGPRN